MGKKLTCGRVHYHPYLKFCKTISSVELDESKNFVESTELETIIKVVRNLSGRGLGGGGATRGRHARNLSRKALYIHIIFFSNFNHCIYQAVIQYIPNSNYSVPKEKSLHKYSPSHTQHKQENVLALALLHCNLIIAVTLLGNYRLWGRRG